MEHGERPLKWGRLKRILADLGCSSELASGVGNRLNIHRDVLRRRRLGGARLETLQTQVAYSDDGRDVERNTIHKIRFDLQLDEEHGIDSSAFYGQAATPSP